jgi:hypothetical protein
MIVNIQFDESEIEQLHLSPVSPNVVVILFEGAERDHPMRSMKPLLHRAYPRGQGKLIQFWRTPEGQSITRSLEMREMKPNPASPATMATHQLVLVMKR